MCDFGLPCGKLDCPCSGALKPLGEDVSALRRLEARRVTVFRQRLFAGSDAGGHNSSVFQFKQRNDIVDLSKPIVTMTPAEKEFADSVIREHFAEDRTEIVKQPRVKRRRWRRTSL